MVIPEKGRELEKCLGTLMTAGAFGCISISFVSLVFLVVSDYIELPWLQIIAGAGIVGLILTPVIVLVAIGMTALKNLEKETVFTVLGLLVILAGGLLQNFFGCFF
jgi:hypothetical protein